MNSKCHGYESWNSSAPLLPKRIFCHFGFKVLPMKRGCKGQAPSFWHHYFLACPEQNVLHVLELVSNGLDAAGAGKWGGRLQGPPLRAGPQRMPDFFSHILQSQWKHWKTTHSHQLSSVTRRPQEKSMSKYQRRGRGVGGGQQWSVDSKSFKPADVAAATITSHLCFI